MFCAGVVADVVVMTENVDYGNLMQAAADAHMEKVWNAFYAEEETGEEVESPAVGPFCGCETCVTREILAGAWPVIEAHFIPRTSSP